MVVEILGFGLPVFFGFIVAIVVVLAILNALIKGIFHIGKKGVEYLVKGTGLVIAGLSWIAVNGLASFLRILDEMIVDLSNVITGETQLKDATGSLGEMLRQLEKRGIFSKSDFEDILGRAFRGARQAKKGAGDAEENAGEEEKIIGALNAKLIEILTELKQVHTQAQKEAAALGKEGSAEALPIVTEIERLGSELQGLRTEIVSLESSNQSRQKNIAEINDSTKAVLDKIGELRSRQKKIGEGSDLNNEILHLEGVIDDETAVAETLKAQIAQMVSGSTDPSIITKSRQGYDVAVLNVRQAKLQLAQKESLWRTTYLPEIKAFQSAISSLQIECETNEGKVKLLVEQIQQGKTKVLEIQTKIKGKERELQGLMVRIKAMNAKVKELLSKGVQEAAQATA